MYDVVQRDFMNEHAVVCESGDDQAASTSSACGNSSKPSADIIPVIVEKLLPLRYIISLEYSRDQLTTSAIGRWCVLYTTHPTL